MRRGLMLLLAMLVFGSLGGASSAADVNWLSLPYFDAPNMRERLTTDSTWSGSKAVNAAPFNFPADSTWPKLKKQWIWAPTCGTAAQRVVFSKTFLVPGEPLTGRLSFVYGPGNQFYGGRPYVSAQFLVNGVEIGKLGDTAHFPRKAQPEISSELDARDRKAFRFGWNTLTIRVERAALKKGERCTRPAATSGGLVRYIAVAADLNLAFGGDLQAVPPAIAQQVRKNLKSGDQVTLKGSVAFQNKGPSASIGGNLLVNVNGDGTTLLVGPLTSPNAPLQASQCTMETQRIQCRYAVIPAGYSVSIDVGATVKVNTGFFRNGVGTLTVMWSITGPGPDTGKGPNNTSQTVMILCATGSPDPRCA